MDDMQIICCGPLAPKFSAQPTQRRSFGKRLWRISMHGLCRECWQTYGHVLRSLGAGRTVLHPLPARSDNCLPRRDIQSSIPADDAKSSSQDHRVFLEFGRLARLNPAGWTDHSRNADRLAARIDAANELFDSFRRTAGSLNYRGCGDECW